MLPALFALGALFTLLFLARLGGARRYEVMKRWPALVLAGAALFALARGALWPAIAFALGSVIVWALWPRLAQRLAPAAKKTADDPADRDARSILGVGAAATPAEIRAAYRTRMAQAHPDRGGTHAEAARLTAARDRLLGKKR
jgi:hypothetical protein